MFFRVQVWSILVSVWCVGHQLNAVFWRGTVGSLSYCWGSVRFVQFWSMLGWFLRTVRVYCALCANRWRTSVSGSQVNAVTPIAISRPGFASSSTLGTKLPWPGSHVESRKMVSPPTGFFLSPRRPLVSGVPSALLVARSVFRGRLCFLRKAALLAVVCSFGGLWYLVISMQTSAFAIKP